MSEPAAEQPELEKETPDSRLRLVAVLLLSVTSAVVLIWAFRLALDSNRIKLDEECHIKQIQVFMAGQWALIPGPEDPTYSDLAMIPGFHLAVANFCKVVGTGTLGNFRAFSWLCLILIGLTAWQISRREHRSMLAAAETTGMTIFFLPLFLYSMLIYTDALAFALLLIGIQLCRCRRYVASSLVLTACLLVRQNLVVATGIMLIYGLLREGSGRLQRSSLKSLPLLLPNLLFVVFFVWNDFHVGLDPPSRQPLTLSLGNIIFSLVGLVIIAWPLLPGLWERAIGRIRRRPWLLSPVLALAVATGFFHLQHKWNFLVFFTRNGMLDTLTTTTYGRIVFVVTVIAGGIAMLGIQFRQKYDFLLVGIWGLLLLPTSFVEPRYQIPALLPLLIFRAPEEHWAWRSLAWGWMMFLAVTFHSLQMDSIYML